MASADTVARAILTAGFQGNDAAIMLSIGQAESGLYEFAIKDDDIERSLGWPQINTRAHPGVSDACCYDIQCAANYSFMLYTGRGNQFTDWSTYNGGQYLQYMDSSVATFTAITNGDWYIPPTPIGTDITTSPVKVALIFAGILVGLRVLI